MNFNTRYSIRKYIETRIEKEKIDELLEVMLTSPSGKNKKPWEIIVIDEPETIEKLSKCKTGGASFVKYASHILMVVSLPEQSDTWVEDASIVLTVGHLKAHDMGLGSCWIQVKSRYNEEGPSIDFVREAMAIPMDKEVVGFLSLGYPDESPKREKIADMAQVHYQQYGQKYD